MMALPESPLFRARMRPYPDRRARGRVAESKRIFPASGIRCSKRMGHSLLAVMNNSHSIRRIRVPHSEM